MFDDDLDLFYADFGVQVSRQSGAFRGLLDVADVVAFEAVTHGTHVLRHATSVGLANGERITIAGQSYTVAAPPQRIDDGRESLAELVRA